MGDMADMCLESAGSGWEETWHRDDGSGSRCEPFGSRYGPFNYDELFYHKRYKKIKRIHETDKAVLFEGKKGQFWCPKKLIKYDIYIWKGFTPEYLEVENY